MYAAIIVAGGNGQRMNSVVPKQFLELNGKPILMYSIKAFYDFDNNVQLVLVLPEVQIKFWEDLCQKHGFTIPHKIVKGGENRFSSVKNGLNLIGNECFIAVHDGVRPLVSKSTIERCFEMAKLHQAVVPVIDLIDSIREITLDGSLAKDRTKYKIVQTPQVFLSALLKKAYLQEYSELFTDDASVVERFGKSVEMVEGNRENIKITTATDLAVAEYLLK